MSNYYAKGKVEAFKKRPDLWERFKGLSEREWEAIAESFGGMRVTPSLPMNPNAGITAQEFNALKHKSGQIWSYKEEPLFEPLQTENVFIPNHHPTGDFHLNPRNNPFANFPDGIKEGQSPFILEGENGLVINDIHLGNHYLAALLAALNEGKRRKVDFIFINGDLMDNTPLSRWEKSHAQKGRWVQDKLLCRQFFEALREMFPDANIVWKFGNHDEWFERLLANDAPAISEDPDISLEKSVHTEKYGITVVKHSRLVKFCDYTLIHGHEKGFSIGGANPVAKMLREMKVNCAGAHVHIKEDATAKSANGVIRGYIVGCLSDLDPKYNPYNRYDHGCAFMTRQSDGTALFDNRLIVNGRVC